MKRTAKIPVGWLPYSPIGHQVPGTRFIAFKVPLRECFVDKLKPEDRFTISILLDRVPELGLIIDLTQTIKYYNKDEILDRGVDYVKISTPGQAVPLQQYVDRFFEVVDYYLDTHKEDDSLIGVHCTHGVNRTGYMLCRYLIQRLGYSYEEAVNAVGTARGHMIERSPYLASLRTHRDIVKKKTIRGDLEEGKSKMPKKSVVKTPKKVEQPRPVGKERFGRREPYLSPSRDLHRSRSPLQRHPRHSPIRFDDRDLDGPPRGDRGIMPTVRDRVQASSVRDRLQPPLQRTRTPPPMRGLSPHHMPPPSRGRSSPPMRGRTPPPPQVRGRTPPPHMQVRGPPSNHMRGRSPPTPQMRGRSPPHMRGRSPPQLMRGRTPPPPHVRGRTPPHIRGRTPPPIRGRTPPVRGRTPPPVRGRTPPIHSRGRSPPPPVVRGRTPPGQIRTHSHIRGRSPPHPQVRDRTPPGMSRSAMPMRGRTPPPSQIRGRSPQFHLRGRSPLPPTRERTPPAIVRGRSPIDRGGRGRTSPIHRRTSPLMSRGRSPHLGPRGTARSPPRGRPDPGLSHAPPPPRDTFSPPRGRSPPPSRREPPPRGRSPPPARRSPVSEGRRDIPASDSYYGYRGEYESRRTDSNRDYSDRFHSAPSYSGDPSSSSQYYSGTYDQPRRERSRSPHRRDPYYPDRRDGRKEVSPNRDLKRRRKSPVVIRDKSRRSPHDYSNGRENMNVDSRNYQPQHWDRNTDPDGPDCREILNEKRSLRDPYTEALEGEYDDRRRSSFLEALPPKNVDLRESLEEEKRRKQGGYSEQPYPADDYSGGDRKKPRRDYPDPGYQHSELPGTRTQYDYDYQYPPYQGNSETFPPADSRRPGYSGGHFPDSGDTFSRPPEQFNEEFRRPRGRGGKRIFDRLNRGGGRGRGSNRI